MLICKKGDTGGACTCVVTEFTKPFPGQEEAFRAEIQIFEPELIDMMIKEHISDYRKFHDNSDIIEDEQERDDLSAAAESAFEIFYALFSDRNQFLGIESAHEFLRASSEAYVAATFARWIDELLNVSKVHNGIITKSAGSSSELAGKLSHMVSTMEAEVEDGQPRKPSLWPLIKIVR